MRGRLTQALFWLATALLLHDLLSDQERMLPLAPLNLGLERGTPGQCPVDWQSSRQTDVWSIKDRTTRLVDVVLAWTVFQHFYHYFDCVGAHARLP